MKKKFTIGLTLLALSNLTLAQVYFDELSEEQLKKLELIKKSKSTSALINRKASVRTEVNPNLEVTRNDPRVVSVNMSVNDTVNTKICYASPLRILLDGDREKIGNYGLSENSAFFSAALGPDKRSVVVSVKKEVPRDGSVWPGFLSIYRDSDSKGYNINLEATACPALERRGNYPQELRITPLNEKVDRLNQPLLNPRQFLTELTYATPRKHIHKVKVGLMEAHSNYSKVHLPITIEVEKDESRKSWDFEVSIVDSLQIQRFPSKTQLVKYSSIKESRINKTLTFDLNSVISVPKKYIKERSIINLIIVDRDKSVHYHGQINLREHYEILKSTGHQLN